LVGGADDKEASVGALAAICADPASLEIRVRIVILELGKSKRRELNKMDGKAPMHTPGPYYLEAVPDSHDIDIVSGDREVIARVMSKASGLERAPEDEAAQRNVALLRQAPQMRQVLEIILEREHEPMHPMIADSVRRLLDEINVGYRSSIAHQRQMNLQRIDMQSRVRAAQENSKKSQATAAQADEEDEPGHSWG